MEKIHKVKKEKIIEKVIFIMSFFSFASLLIIVLILFNESFYSIRKIGICNMLTGMEWYPTDSDNPSFGMLPLIISSIYITFLSLFISVPLGISSAIYISEIADRKVKMILKPLIELISSVPSVVFGFIGVSIFVPYIQKVLNLPTGYSIFTSSVVLGLMATPIISSLCEDSLNMVPQSFREASYALGANKYDTIIKIILPAASSGIFTSIILGLGRIIGETMVVLMLSGGSAVVPESIFDPARPMTSAIASEMGEAVVGSLHYSALFFIALILFLITSFISIISEFISRKYSLKLGEGR